MDLTTNKMNKNTNISSLDLTQINMRKFDETYDADRVVIVGGDFTIDSDKIAQAVKEGISNIEFKSNSEPQAQFVKEQVFQTIEKNVFIPQIEFKTIEVPVIIKEIEIREIEKQVIVPIIEYKEVEKIVYIPQIEYKTIEKPVIVEKIEYREINTNNVPNWIKYMLFGQMALIILSFLLRK